MLLTNPRSSIATYIRRFTGPIVSCFLQNWMKCVLDDQIMSIYWEKIGELESAILHHRRRNGGAPGHRAPSWTRNFNNDSGRCMERMRTKVGCCALPCAPTLMLQPWVEDRFESWCVGLADLSVVFFFGGGGMGPIWWRDPSQGTPKLKMPRI